MQICSLMWLCISSSVFQSYWVIRTKSLFQWDANVKILDEVIGIDTLKSMVFCKEIILGNINLSQNIFFIWKMTQLLKCTTILKSVKMGLSLRLFLELLVHVLWLVSLNSVLLLYCTVGTLGILDIINNLWF
jgi:hypothetical protein